MVTSKIQKLYHEAGHCIFAEYYGRKVDSSNLDLDNPKVIVDSVNLNLIDYNKLEEFDQYIENLNIDIRIHMAGRLSELKANNHSIKVEIYFGLLSWKDESFDDTKSDEFKIKLKVETLVKLYKLKSIKTYNYLIFEEQYKECQKLINSENIWDKIKDFVNTKFV